MIKNLINFDIESREKFLLAIFIRRFDEITHIMRKQQQLDEAEIDAKVNNVPKVNQEVKVRPTQLVAFLVVSVQIVHTGAQERLLHTVFVDL